MAKSSAAPRQFSVNDLDERFTVNSFACGCLIRSEFENGAGQKWISYCALHRNAQALYEALSALSEMYVHAWDRVDGGLVMLEGSVAKFDKAHAMAEKALALADAAQEGEANG